MTSTWIDAAALLTWPISLVAFRCVPFIAYAFLSRNVGVEAKFVSGSLFASLLLLADTLDQDLSEVLVRAPIALAYFAALSLALGPLHRLLPSGRSHGPSFLAIATAGYLVAPALVVRSPIVVPTIVVGWEAMLSAYSYYEETRRSGARHGLRPCLFFILVDPTLVYPERGARLARPAVLSGALRCTLGVLTWVLQGACVVALSGTAFRSVSTVEHGLFSPSMLFVLFWANALVLYLAHSGLASVQIGLMRVAGWQVRERYIYPFLATSPGDFWRRWNAYVGSWARRYLFLPWALLIGRTRRVSNLLAKGVAAQATFVAVGVLHAVVQYLATAVGEPRQWGPTHVVGLFTAFGLLFVIWEGVARLKRRTSKISWPRHSRAGAVASWLLFSNVMYLMTWLALSPFG